MAFTRIVVAKAAQSTHKQIMEVLHGLGLTEWKDFQSDGFVGVIDQIQSGERQLFITPSYRGNVGEATALIKRVKAKNPNAFCISFSVAGDIPGADRCINWVSEELKEAVQLFLSETPTVST
jgi:hypothetical protein